MDPENTQESGTSQANANQEKNLCADKLAELSISPGNQQQPSTSGASQKEQNVRQQPKKQAQKQTDTQSQSGWPSLNKEQTVPQTATLLGKPQSTSESKVSRKEENVPQQQPKSEKQPSTSGATQSKQQNVGQQPKKQAQKQADTQSQSLRTTNQRQGVPQTTMPPGQNVPKKEQTAGERPSTSNAAKKGQKQRQDVTQPQSQSANQQMTKAEVTTDMPHLLCPYKGAGTRGLKFKSLIETNYLKLNIDKMKSLAYHYDVTIEPDKPKKNMTKIFQQFCDQNFRGTGIAFDGARNAYSPVVLNLDNVEREVDFTHPETGGVRKYLVSIKETDTMQISLNPLRT